MKAGVLPALSKNRTSNFWQRGVLSSWYSRVVIRSRREKLLRPPLFLSFLFASRTNGALRWIERASSRPPPLSPSLLLCPRSFPPSSVPPSLALALSTAMSVYGGKALSTTSSHGRRPSNPRFASVTSRIDSGPNMRKVRPVDWSPFTQLRPHVCHHHPPTPPSVSPPSLGVEPYLVEFMPTMNCQGDGEVRGHLRPQRARQAGRQIFPDDQAAHAREAPRAGARQR